MLLLRFLLVISNELEYEGEWQGNDGIEGNEANL